MYKIKKTTLFGIFITFFGFLTVECMQPGTPSIQQDNNDIYFSDSDSESKDACETHYYNQTPVKNEISEQDPDLTALANIINQQKYKKKTPIYPLLERPASMSSPIPPHIHVSESPKPENNDRRSEAYFKPINPALLTPHRTVSVPANMSQMDRTESPQPGKKSSNKHTKGTQSPLARTTSSFKNKK